MAVDTALSSLIAEAEVIVSVIKGQEEQSYSLEHNTVAPLEEISVEDLGIVQPPPHSPIITIYSLNHFWPSFLHGHPDRPAVLDYLLLVCSINIRSLLEEELDFR